MFNMQDVKEYMRWADRAIADIARELDMDADAVRAVVEQWEAQRRNKEERDNPLAMRMQCTTSEPAIAIGPPPSHPNIEISSYSGESPFTLQVTTQP